MPVAVAGRVKTGTVPLRRDASREGLANFRKSYGRSPERVSTLGEMQRTPGGWCWLYCNNLACNHSAPVAIAPFVIRWGPDTSSDVLRRSARCSKCGSKGATTIRASWVDTEVGFAPFPTRRH